MFGLLLESTSALAENVVAQKKLFEIPCRDEKLAVLYHVEVSQTQLRKEAYDYYRILRDEIERTGGLFSIVMSAGDNGNIYNLSDPNELVIGYVEVSQSAKKSIYIPYDIDLYEGRGETCRLWEADAPGIYPWVTGLHYSTWNCVDCRERYNATKNKPSWWPTDHL